MITEIIKRLVIKKLKDNEEVIIATDFDDTLVEDKCFPEFGKPTPWFHTVKELQANFPNLKLILWTCREGKYLASAITFCYLNGLMFDAINSDVPSSIKWKGKTRKPFADVYVDDRNLTIKDAVSLERMFKEC